MGWIWPTLQFFAVLGAWILCIRAYKESTSRYYRLERMILEMAIALKEYEKFNKKLQKDMMNLMEKAISK